MAISSQTFIFSLLALTLAYSTSAHNITEMLSSDADFSQFNSYLSQTKLADEINARTTITVLAIPNSGMSTVTSGHPLSSIKDILSLHVILDYFDNKKLKSLKQGTVSATSLYRTTGQAKGDLGQINITDLKGGSVGFGSGNKLGPTYVKEIKTIPYTISVIEISAPIIVPELMKNGTDAVNITGVLDTNGCKIFAALLSSSGVLKMYQQQMSNGITIFAPKDKAFEAKGVPDVSKLTSADQVALLQFHALNSYAPVGTLKTWKGNLNTLASGEKYILKPTVNGDSITLKTGVSSSRVADTLLDSPPVSIFSVDYMLLPRALFAGAPAPAPTPVSDSPTPAPAKAPKKAPMSSPTASPPSPPMDSPSESPDTADAPHPDKHKNDGVRASGSLFKTGAVSVVAAVISFVL